MKKFSYKAKKNLKETVAGEISAESQQDAVNQLTDSGLVPVDVAEVRISKEPIVNQTKTSFTRKVSSRELMVFYGQLARLVKSGVPILRALAVIGEQTENSRMREVLERVQKSVKEGAALSAAFAVYPKVFPAFDIAMIQTGESVGKLEEVLVKLVSYLEQQQNLRSKITAAVAYPIFIICMGIATVFIMITFVIPKFSVFFSDLGQELPFMTKILIAVSHKCQKYWLFMVAALAGIVGLFRIQLRIPSNRKRWDAFVLKTPKIGSLVLRYEISKLARSLELLLKSGMQVLRAMKIAIPVVQNEALRAELETCCKILEEGGYLSAGLRQSKLFPPLLYHLIGVGEESGRLEESLREVAEWYEQETAQMIQILTNLLEPVIILVVGSILGAVIIAVLMPIFSINALT